MHRPRFTAKNALIVLFVWLTLALMYHLKVELYDPPTANDPHTPGHSFNHDGRPHFSDGGNEPYYQPKDADQEDLKGGEDVTQVSVVGEPQSSPVPSGHFRRRIR
jgi:hypothetical protein